MELNERLNQLITENNALRRRLREPGPSHAVWLIALIVGFALGVLYAG